HERDPCPRALPTRRGRYRRVPTRARRALAGRRLVRRFRSLIAASIALIAPSACVVPVDLGGATSGVGGEAPPQQTALPPVATAFTNVVPTVWGDSVGIDFDPVDGAVDYRVYPLPTDGDVTVGADGRV